MANTANLGVKIGPRIAELVSQALVSTHGQLSDHKVAVGSQLVEQLLTAHGQAAAPFAAPWLAKLAQSPHLDADTKAWLQALQGTPALIELISAFAGIFGVMQASSAVGMNNLASSVGWFLAQDPETLLQPSVLAGLYAHGIVNEGPAALEASGGGINGERFAALTESLRTYPGVPDLLLLSNRGLISDDELAVGMQRSGLPPGWVHQVLGLRETLLAPADLAGAVLRGWMTQAEGAAEAAKQGLSAKRFAVLTDITGMPPGLMQLLEAYRRGIIDKTRLVHGIRTSDVRDEWVDVVEALRYQPPGYGVVIEAEVKGHLDSATAKRMLSEAGIDPVNHDWMYAATGNPPGGMEMLSLWNRGEIDRARVEESLRQGHLADAYIPDVLKLRRRLVPEGTLLQVQQTGAMTRAEVVSYLQDLGYDARDSGVLAAAGSRAKIALDWQAAKTLVTDAYQAGQMSRADAQAYLETVGYEADEAEAIMSIADLARLVSQQNSAISKVRTLYVAYHIDGPTARSALAGLGVPGTQITDILTIWQLEREAAAKVLTEAQVADAFEYSILSQEEAQAQLERLGYPALQAWTLLSIKAKQALPGKPGG